MTDYAYKMFEKPSALSQAERNRWMYLRETVDLGGAVSKKERDELRSLERRMRA